MSTDSALFQLRLPKDLRRRIHAIRQARHHLTSDTAAILWLVETRLEELERYGVRKE